MYIRKIAEIFNTALTAQSAQNRKRHQNHLSVYITWDIYLCPFPQFASTKASPETLADS